MKRVLTTLSMFFMLMAPGVVLAVPANALPQEPSRAHPHVLNLALPQDPTRAQSRV